jgi:AraC family transcriptional regulator
MLNAVETMIRERTSEPVNVSTLASAIGVSRSHFSRAFHKLAGEPPRAYISRMRVERAMSLMREGDISLGEIALVAGFADQAHFSNAFRRATGATPLQWRNARR